MPVRIETDRLLLRPLAPADADDVTAYQSLEECVRFVPFGVRNKDDVLAAFARQPAAESLERDGDYYILGLEDKVTGKVVGQVNAGFERAEPKTASIGYLTHSAFWRKGITREAIVALINYLFDIEKVERLTAWIVAGNDASEAFAQALGMRREATFVDSEVQKGELISLHVYAMLKHEWLAKE